MKNSHQVSTFLVFLLLGTQQLLCFQKTLEYTDHSYEATIKTVKLFPEGTGIPNSLAPAVKKLNDRKSLILEFDDLKEDADYFYIRFIHCDADWTPSDYKSNMVVEGYNEFEIDDFEFSTEAKIGYVHYRYKFPQFKTSGNFLAVVYRNQNKEDLVLTRRFMVTNDKAKVGARIVLSSAVQNRRSHQRIEVTMNYNSLTSQDPGRDFKIIVRQNQRWDNAKTNLPATFIDENSKVIDYRNLGEENDFAGGNEFRFFDLSTVNFSGHNVKEIKFINNRPVAQIMQDKVLHESYLQNLDLNGKYYIRDQEANSKGNTEEYVETVLSLSTPQQRSNIYVLGDFNNWQRNSESLLKFDPVQNLYSTTLLLKQGWYDYTYWLDDPLNPHQLDQSFYNTENMYEVFVYFKPMGGRGDELVGYFKLDYNSRR